MSGFVAEAAQTACIPDVARYFDTATRQWGYERICCAAGHDACALNQWRPLGVREKDDAQV